MQRRPRKENLTVPPLKGGAETQSVKWDFFSLTSRKRAILGILGLSTKKKGCVCANLSFRIYEGRFLCFGNNKEQIKYSLSSAEN